MFTIGVNIFFFLFFREKKTCEAVRVRLYRWRISRRILRYWIWYKNIINSWTYIVPLKRSSRLIKFIKWFLKIWIINRYAILLFRGNMHFRDDDVENYYELPTAAVICLPQRINTPYNNIFMFISGAQNILSNSIISHYDVTVFLFIVYGLVLVY